MLSLLRGSSIQICGRRLHYLIAQLCAAPDRYVMRAIDAALRSVLPSIHEYAVGRAMVGIQGARGLFEDSQVLSARTR
jgi:hypothetical protein